MGGSLISTAVVLSFVVLMLVKADSFSGVLLGRVAVNDLTILDMTVVTLQFVRVQRRTGDPGSRRCRCWEVVPGGPG